MSFIKKDSSNDIQLMFRDELFMNAIYTVWTVYCDTINVAKKENAIEFNEYISNINIVFANKLNVYNQTCAKLIMHHHASILDFESFNYGDREVKERGVFMRYNMMKPNVTCYLDNLTDFQINIYQNTWCVNEFHAKIHDKRFEFIPLKFEKFQPRSLSDDSSP